MVFRTFFFFKRYPTEIPELVHKEGFLGQTGVSTGSFLIDSTLGRDTQFGIYVEDEEDHLIKSIRFTDSKGKTYGPFHRMSSDFDLINFKTINFPAGQSPPFSAVSFTFAKIFSTLSIHHGTSFYNLFEGKFSTLYIFLTTVFFTIRYVIK